MFSIPIIIATGPALMMIMAALALFIVYHSLIRVWHALIWSAAFTVSGLRWSYVAASGLLGGPEMPGGLVFDLLGIGSMLLFAEGFRLRSGERRPPWVTPAIGVTALVLAIVLYAIPALPIRAALVPAASIALLAWSGMMVTPPDSHRSLAEMAVMAMLGLLAAIHLAGLAAAVGEQIGVVASHHLYLGIYAATLDPVSAATGLFVLLLIAFDLSAELRRMVHTDPLTGVLNRLGFEHAVAGAFKRLRGRRRPLSLALADIDGFKGINDRYGHVAGDAALVGFARHLSHAIEREEAVGRIGGEEFALLLPGSNSQRALERIEAIRRSLSDIRADGIPSDTVTASFGIAERGAGEELATLMERADKALYRSKREGRDRSTLAEQFTR